MMRGLFLAPDHWCNTDLCNLLREVRTSKNVRASLLFRATFSSLHQAAAFLRCGM